jgi:hypothetical protein
MKRYEVSLYCPALSERKTYLVRGGSSADAWTKGLGRLFNRFPAILTYGLAVGGGAKVARAGGVR